MNHFWGLTFIGFILWATFFREKNSFNGSSNDDLSNSKKRNPQKEYKLPKAKSAAALIKHITDNADDNEDLLVDDITYQSLGLDKSSKPNSQCFYTVNVTFNRGGKLEKRSLTTEAYSPGDARNKFQDIIDKNLKDATLESLSIRKIDC